MKAIGSMKDAAAWQTPLVVLTGLGISQNDLSPDALSWIERAQVLVGGRRHLRDFAEHPAQKISLESPLDHVMEKIKEISAQRRTMVLASGDPLFFGIGRRLVKSLGKNHLYVLPNISAVQYLFSRLLEPWEDAKVISLHGRETSSGSQSWLKEIRNNCKVAIYTDPHNTPGKIAEQLAASGISDCVFVVGEDLGSPAEKVRCLSLEEAQSAVFSPLNIVAVLRAEASSSAQGWQSQAVFGLAEDDFQHQAGLITKMEIRAVVLANLQLKPGLILWDLGAGSGSLSIEAARIVTLNKAYAVEKNSERYQDLVKNVLRFGAHEIVTVNDDAFNALERLPDPDRVFIGGAGDNLTRLLERCMYRLREGGRIVQTIVTLETLQRVLAFWQDKSYERTVTQIQINRSSPILNTLRLQALNPVFIVTAWQRPDGKADL